MGERKQLELKGQMERMKRLEEENRKLREDNEMLLNIMVQMKVTLNRLVNRYVVEQSKL
ncbi:MAG: hypothetical protein HFG60_12165 [Lachnospiraceae bacterium]|nr:hypothetical protein [Lachnospiraceae bacterium]MCI9185288.1 hypothetical protein [Lachnospiraceae bacterium]